MWTDINDHVPLESDPGLPMKTRECSTACDSRPMRPNWRRSSLRLLPQLVAARESAPVHQDQAPATAAGDADLWVIDSDGTNANRVTHLASNEAVVNASWAPDGARIVYTACVLVTFNGCTIHTANADGSGDANVSVPTAPLTDAYQRRPDRSRPLEWTVHARRRLRVRQGVR
jgi:dipeptidyl aminopeptidase/acylaminoacyl peptidase